MTTMRSGSKFKVKFEPRPGRFGFQVIDVVVTLDGAPVAPGRIEIRPEPGNEGWGFYVGGSQLNVTRTLRGAKGNASSWLKRQWRTKAAALLEQEISTVLLDAALADARDVAAQLRDPAPVKW